MAFTLVEDDVGQDYLINFYRTKKYGDKYLITQDNGAWVLLDENEYKLLRTYMVHKNPDLFFLLKQKGFVITNDNWDSVVESYRERFHFLNNGPTLHIVVPTFRCNMKCVYCHSLAKPLDAKGWDMDEETAKRIVDFILTSPSDSVIIEFQGGEPLEKFDIIKTIIDYAQEKSREKHKRVFFTLVTNLTEMTEEKLEFLKSRNVRGISTSLDGPKELHNKNRKYAGGSGSYDDVVYWVKRIKTEFRRDFNLSAMTTVTRWSLDYAKEIPRLFAELGFYHVWPRYLNQLGFSGIVWDKIGYTMDEYLDFFRKVVDETIQINKEGTLLVENFTRIIARKILNRRDPNFVDLQSPCGAGGIGGQLVYDHNGDIYTCDEAKIMGDTFKLGNVKTSTMKEVLSHPTTLSMVDVSSKFGLICDNCPFSPYCGICPVHSYTRYGDIIPKLQNDYRCRINKALIDQTFQRILFKPDERKILMNWAKPKMLIG